MSSPAKRARIGAVIKLLCDQFPHTFSLHDPQPLKIGVHEELVVTLGDAVPAPDLQFALRAYTSTARYLRGLSAGARRIGLDGTLGDTVTPEDEAVAKRRLANSTIGAAPRTELSPAGQAGPETPANRPTAEIHKSPAPSAPKRLSLADLREAGRRRREAPA
jgi:ProP effector